MSGSAATAREAEQPELTMLPGQGGGSRQQAAAGSSRARIEAT